MKAHGQTFKQIYDKHLKEASLRQFERSAPQDENINSKNYSEAILTSSQKNSSGMGLAKHCNFSFQNTINLNQLAASAKAVAQQQINSNQK